MARTSMPCGFVNVNNSTGFPSRVIPKGSFLIIHFPCDVDENAELTRRETNVRHTERNKAMRRITSVAPRLETSSTHRGEGSRICLRVLTAVHTTGQVNSVWTGAASQAPCDEAGNGPPVGANGMDSTDRTEH